MSQEEPVRAPHPTVYNVVLGRAAAVQFEANLQLRARKLTEWSQKAHALGKRSVEVMGPCCRLAQVEVAL